PPARRRGRARAFSRRDGGRPRLPQAHPAPSPSCLGQRLHQSTGRLRRAPDRGGGFEGKGARRRAHQPDARQLDRQRGRRHRLGRAASGGARPGRGAGPVRNPSRPGAEAIGKVAAMEDLKRKRIGILYGGPSTEREVSLWSGEAVHRALVERGYDAILIDLDSEVDRRLREERIEVVFNALHGRIGEDGCVQGLLETLRIPYTGSGVLASAMAMNKEVSKAIFRFRGIPTPRSCFFPGRSAIGRRLDELPFELPVVIKPVCEGSSVGVTIVREEGALAAALEFAASFGGGVLVEEFVGGMEVHVAILEDEAIGAIQVIP